MIILLCGPSGAGKSTLLANLPVCSFCRCITVTVSRPVPRKHADPGKVELALSEFATLQPTMRFLYDYDNCRYGFSISSQDIDCADYAFIDYPGEYPQCAELQHIPWRGLLVLPPNAAILRERLFTAGRSHRVTAALTEYRECLAELGQGFYDPPRWRIYISGDQNDLEGFARVVADRLLFVS